MIELGIHDEDLDMLDDLRTLVQRTNPEQEESVKDLTGQIATSIVETFQKFMLPEQVAALGFVMDRVIIVDKGAFLNLKRSYHNDDQLRPSKGFYTSEGKFIALEYDPDFWEEFKKIDPELVAMAIRQVHKGNESEAREYIEHGELISRLSHELLHFFHDPNLTFYFAEIAIPLYQKIINGKAYFSTDSFEPKRAEFYQTLVGKFGDNIHRYFFGQEIDLLTKTQIEASISQDVLHELLRGIQIEHYKE